ncbi:MAG: hypothetical protein ACE5E2_04110 [Candidatus Binatia bacterium]
MGRSLGGWVLVRATIPALVALGIAMVPPPIHGEQRLSDTKALARQLAAIEEKDPFHLRDLVRNGRPTLIAFIDHLCFTCLQSVGTVEELKSRFSDKNNITVIDPSRISVAHGWAKDRYRVWFVPKFVILDKHGDVAKEYFGPTPIQTLTSDLQSLQAQ